MGQSLIIQGIVSKLLLYSSTSTTGRSGTNQRFFAVDLLIYIYIYIYIYFLLLLLFFFTEFMNLSRNSYPRGVQNRISQEAAMLELILFMSKNQKQAL